MHFCDLATRIRKFNIKMLSFTITTKYYLSIHIYTDKKKSKKDFQDLEEKL